jgi:hypothetical protein
MCKAPGSIWNKRTRNTSSIKDTFKIKIFKKMENKGMEKDRTMIKKKIILISGKTKFKTKNMS